MIIVDDDISLTNQNEVKDEIKQFKKEEDYLELYYYIKYWEL